MNDKKCYWCEQLEKGDYLCYSHSDDVGICYEYIENIQFCPICGKSLLTFEEKYKNETQRDN